MWVSFTQLAAAGIGGYWAGRLRGRWESTPGAGGPSSTNEERAASSAEVTRIFVNGLSTGTLPPQDGKYVGQMVAQRTGLAQADAEKRVTETFGRMRRGL